MSTPEKPAHEHPPNSGEHLLMSAHGDTHPAHERSRETGERDGNDTMTPDREQVRVSAEMKGPSSGGRTAHGTQRVSTGKRTTARAHDDGTGTTKRMSFADAVEAARDCYAADAELPSTRVMAAGIGCSKRARVPGPERASRGA